jgi:hypothetical protein
VVVDLRRVETWDVRGLHGLAEAVDHRRRQGGITAFIAADPGLKDLAAAAGVLERLDFYDALRLEGAPLPPGRHSPSDSEIAAGSAPTGRGASSPFA